MNGIIPVITIDGPSGVGKSTLSKKIAITLKWKLLNSGIIYRILAETVLYKGIHLHNEDEVINLIYKMKIDFIKIQDQFIIFHNNRIIRSYIYTEMIGNLASKISTFPKVRHALLIYQRKYCIFPGLVADGRDMGTIVFPDAVAKIFLNASFQVRKQRRLEQLQKINFNVNFKLLQSQIKERDNRDCNRDIAPLKPALDALVLNTTHLSEVEVENKVLMYVKKII